MQADVRSKASKSKTSQPVLSSSSSTISNSSEGAFPGDSTNPSHGNEANRIDRAVKLRDAFERFWDHARRNVEFIEQYGHIGPVEGWEYRCDTEFENAFRAIEKFLAPVQGARSFRQPRGIPNDAPIIAKSAHEALARFLNPPERLFGVMHIPGIRGNPRRCRRRAGAGAESATECGGGPRDEYRNRLLVPLREVRLRPGRAPRSVMPIPPEAAHDQDRSQRPGPRRVPGPHECEIRRSNGSLGRIFVGPNLGYRPTRWKIA
jgi:hypothetical protein